MTLSYVIWGAWIALFLVLEMLAVFHAVPWVPLSDVVWVLERINRWIRVSVFLGLIVLLSHFVFHWP